MRIGPSAWPAPADADGHPRARSVPNLVPIVLTPMKAPKANANAERWIRTVRRECLDHSLARALPFVTLAPPSLPVSTHHFVNSMCVEVLGHHGKISAVGENATAPAVTWRGPSCVRPA